MNKALVKIIQHDDIYHAMEDPFNNSDSDTVLANFGRSSSGNASSLYLYPDTSYSLGKIYIEYLRYPPKINLGTYTYLDGKIYPAQGSILSDHVHSEIVNMAVKLAATIGGEQEITGAANEQLQLSD